MYHRRGRTDVQVKVHNDGPVAVTSQLALGAPGGWSATPVGWKTRVGTIAARSTGAVTWRLRANQPLPGPVALSALRVGGGVTSSRVVREQADSWSPMRRRQECRDPVRQSWGVLRELLGPGRAERSVGEKAAGDGKRFTVAGTVYPKGLGAHAPGRSVLLNAQCSKLAVSAGIDDEAGDQGQVTFEVWGDGKRLAQAEATGLGGAVALNANLTAGSTSWSCGSIPAIRRTTTTRTG